MGKTGIEITSVTDKAVGLKLPVVALEDLLNESITLNNYGTGVQKIFIVFIAVPPTNTIHEEHIIYTEAELHLEIAVRLDYMAVLEADSEACLLMIKENLIDRLSSIEEIYSKNFDRKRLIEAITKF